MHRLRTNKLDLLAAALLLCASAVAAGGAGLPAPLEPFEAQYRLTDGSSRIGGARMGLEPTRKGWRYYSRVKPEGLYALFVDELQDTTWLETYGDRLRPIRFEHASGDPDEHTTVDFDWLAGQARVRRRQGDTTVPLEPGLHDQFSAMLAVIQAFAAERKRFELPSIDDEGERELLVFEHAGTSSVTVPLGTYRAVRVRRVRENRKRETESWLVPELGWVPVRIDQRRKGELVARLELIEFNGQRAEDPTQPRHR